MNRPDLFDHTRHPDATEMLRAALGELTGHALHTHEARLSSDLPYRAAFERLLRTRDALATLAPPPTASLAAGFDARVLARLRNAESTESLALVMGRQFRRLAPAALAAAVLLIVLTLSAGTTAAATPEVSLSSWYPLSADPTALP